MSQTFILPKLMARDGKVASIAKLIAGLSMARNWKVTIEEARSVRSQEQNAYLNGVAYKILGDHTGYERDEISEYLCGAYWGWKEKRVPKKPSNPEGFESVPIRTTTTDESGKRAVLDKMAFADYVAFVQRFAAKRGVHIPDPDPNYALQEKAA